ncbi:MAG: hypothetical protein BMS9Abin29_1930 [Gemmatimonadota bacterium]|nr:MAG: hypothetical protein BMS9Abin29_1930 [Gemmatimonadota bacterium]
MIDLTPLDVRNKRGDFAKTLRGYDAEEVDSFLELVSERMEELVKEILQLSERAERLTEQVSTQTDREKAVQEALVTAQALREDVKQQALREAEFTRREAKSAADQMVAEANRVMDERKQSIRGLERHRLRFLKSFRTLLERELDTVEVEEGRTPLEDVAIEIDLGGVVERTEDAGILEDESLTEDEIVEVIVEAGDEAPITEVEGEAAADDTDRQDESATDLGGPPEGEPAPSEDGKAAPDSDDDSLWLNSLLDGESRDEGKWS